MAFLAGGKRQRRPSMKMREVNKGDEEDGVEDAETLLLFGGQPQPQSGSPPLTSSPALKGKAAPDALLEMSMANIGEEVRGAASTHAIVSLRNTPLFLTL